MNFLDNDMFQPTPALTPGSYEDDEWFNSFFEDPVLNDKMITDAAQPPRINSEHSYSSSMSDASSPLSDDGKLEDFDCEFLINNTALDLTKKAAMTSVVKTEPVVKSEPEDIDIDPIQMTSTASPTILTRTFTVTKQQPTIILASPGNGHSTALSERSVLPTITVKQEPPDAYDAYETVNVDSLVLPPTPPSSNNSDSDSCPSPQRSAPNSPVRQHPYTRQHHSPSSLSSCSLSPTGSSSKYYNQPLITNQSESLDIVFQQIPQSGVLILSEEEKRTLISEGYPIPNKLPLTKQEEKNLKKIRRKIKNKISAQESRRKKKEYLEALEKRVESFSHENCELKKKVDSLENNNRSLLGQLQKLQSLVGKIRPSGGVPQTGTALMVLVLCFAVFLGSWSPTSLNIGYSTSKPTYTQPPIYPQMAKPSPMMGPPIAGAKVDAYCTPNMKSRVLMSLRGEQDDLNWYEFYGPNVPHTHVDKKSTDTPPAPPAEDVNYGPELNVPTSETNSSENTAVVEEKVEVVKVTVDGRFGQVSNTSDGENLKAVLPADIEQMRVEGRLESAGESIEV